MHFFKLETIKYADKNCQFMHAYCQLVCHNFDNITTFLFNLKLSKIDYLFLSIYN